MKLKKAPDTRTSGSCTKVFIVEDHPVFREGLAQLIRSQPDLRVCGMAESVSQGRRAITRLKPELVLVDITLPGKSGLALIKELRAAGQKAKLLVISMHDEALYANRVLRAGGNGYVMKQEDPAEIIQAVRDVLAGRVYVSEAVLSAGLKPTRKAAAGKPVSALEQLTDAELELLEALGRGRSNAEIARQLQVSARTVSAQALRVRQKLKLRSSHALIRYATCWVEADKE